MGYGPTNPMCSQSMGTGEPLRRAPLATLCQKQLCRTGPTTRAWDTSDINTVREYDWSSSSTVSRHSSIVAPRHVTRGSPLVRLNRCFTLCWMTLPLCPTTHPQRSSMRAAESGGAMMPFEPNDEPSSVLCGGGRWQRCRATIGTRRRTLKRGGGRWWTHTRGRWWLCSCATGGTSMHSGAEEGSELPERDPQRAALRRRRFGRW